MSASMDKRGAPGAGGITRKSRSAHSVNWRSNASSTPVSRHDQDDRTGDDPRDQVHPKNDLAQSHHSNASATPTSQFRPLAQKIVIHACKLNGRLRGDRLVGQIAPEPLDRQIEIEK